MPAIRAPSSRSICARGVIELPLLYPVTTELPACSNGYRDAIRDFYDGAAAADRERISKPAAPSP